MTKIATWNVNSLKVRLGHVLDWLAAEKPEVLALQETKTVDENFPVQEIEAAGYRAAFAGQKTYNGVATLSLAPGEEIATDLPGLDDPQRRVLASTIDGVRVLNVYVPNGQEVGSDKYAYKLDWLERLRAWFEEAIRPRLRICWCGDINIAPTDIDIHDPKRNEGHVCFNPEVREMFARILETGFVDLFRKHRPEPGHYTYFDYRVRAATSRGIGWRVDHLCGTRALAGKSRDAWIDLAPRNLERPSDHTPLVVDFTL